MAVCGGSTQLQCHNNDYFLRLGCIAASINFVVPTVNHKRMMKLMQSTTFALRRPNLARLSRRSYQDWPFLKEEHIMISQTCRNFAGSFHIERDYTLKFDE